MSKFSNGEDDGVKSPGTDDEIHVSDRAALLRKAEEIISFNREGSYGTPEDSFAAIGELWNDYLGRDLQRTLKPGDVAVMMILLKIARLKTGGLDQTDSWLDIAGYAACGFETQHLDRP